MFALALANVANFSSGTFVSNLAKFLDVYEYDITVTDVSAGSVIVSAAILQREAWGDDVKQLLSGDLTALSTALGVQVEAIAFPSPPDEESQSSGSSSDGDSSSSSSSGSIAPLAPVASSATFNFSLLAGAVIGGVGALSLICTLLVRWRQHRMRAAHDAKLIELSLASNDAFAFPLHVLRATDFLEMGQLVIFEDARKHSMHEVVDLVSEASELFGQGGQHLIFLSHQWLSFGAPGTLTASRARSQIPRHTDASRSHLDNRDD